MYSLIRRVDAEGGTIIGSSDGIGEQDDGMGIVTGHSYSVVKAFEVETKEGLVRLLMLRNPWGEKEWTGAWSDNSPLWNDQIKS